MNMIRCLVLMLVVMTVPACGTGRAVTSPNGRLSAEQRGQMLVVSYQGQKVLEVAGVASDAGAALRFVRRISEDYRMVTGKRLACHNEANEYRCGDVVVRLYDDGIAVQGAPSVCYRIPEGCRRWMQQWCDSYEGLYPLSTTMKVRPVPSYSGTSQSAEGWNNRWGFPALMEPRPDVFVLLTEASIGRGQCASFLVNEGEQFRVVPASATHTPSDTTPWQLAIIGRLADVVESTLVTDVSEPCRIADTDWIQPGTVAWVYWAYNHGSKDFRIIKKYVDMAAELRLPYVLIDAEWDEMLPPYTIEDAIAYAKSKGVRPLIWYNSSVGWVDGAPGPKYRLNTPEDREREFRWCEEQGVAGVKIDFFSGDTRENMDFCQDLLECAARHHLLVNFHGATVPRGWQRTWPNLMTTEGVYGAEWYNNVATYTTQAARHHATLPFTRNVIGPMDYTPCAFSDSQHPHITTHGHELALTVLFESGLQHLADRPESFLAQPQAVRDFLSALPAAWDETRLLSGSPGEYVVLARRKGSMWYVAGINGTDEKRRLPLTAITDDVRHVTLFADSGDAAAPWTVRELTALPATLDCLPRGGFVIYVETTPPYQNAALSAVERARDLCSRLTLEEKALLMLDESPAIPRLGIKKFFWWSEALHGAANMGHVTVFPEPVAMASSFNPDLLYKCFDVASTEFRAQYNHRLYDLGGEDMKMRSLSVWTPNVNIFRDPRWGRGQETYGEDPYLTSVMGDAVVRGLQGPETSKYRKLWACAKHYAVHSGPEYTRHTANLTDVPVRDFWETYMPAFKYLVQKSKVREVMCAYQRLDDDPCCGSSRLLQQILRDEWGFRHLVVSDCGAVSDFYTSHKSSSSPVTASAKAVLAGTDVECGYGYAYKSIPEAVRRGLISETEVDRHVVRLLEGRFDLGEMDDPALVEWSKIPYSAMSTKASAALSLEMAKQSIVLLQNKDNILPLDRKERIAVIGPNADNEPMMWGNYNGTPDNTVTILDGIRRKLKIKDAHHLLYLPGCDLTYDKVLESRLATECTAPDGKKGLKGTFWTNTEMEGKPFTTEYYTKPLAVTTNGMHVFAANLPIEDFSARYETVFAPRQAGEYVVNVEGTGHFELYVNGEKQFTHHIWRSTPTRTVLKAQAGQQFRIEVRFHTVKTWGAGMKINIARELPIDYQETIARLKGIETVIFVGGIAPSLEGEEMPVDIDGFKGGDRTSIELPRVQRDFLKALKDAGKKVVFVNCSGSAIALLPETGTCDAIVQAWYPGQEGGTAVADVLFGDYNPSGKLPVTFYKRTEQLPDYEDYSMKGRTYRFFDDALFPFGYGMSYTTFDIGEATYTAEGDTLTVAVPVTNTGKRDGTETVQLYIRRAGDAGGPLKTLRAFQRVSVRAGQSAVATLRLDRERFEFFDDATNTMRVKPGRYEILYGNSSDEKDLKRIEFDVKD